MKLKEEEQKICDYYRREFPDGKVGCNYCPLVIDRRSLFCKFDCTEKEWAAHASLKEKNK